MSQTHVTLRFIAGTGLINIEKFGTLCSNEKNPRRLRAPQSPQLKQYTNSQPPVVAKTENN